MSKATIELDWEQTIEEPPYRSEKAYIRSSRAYEEQEDAE